MIRTIVLFLLVIFSTTGYCQKAKAKKTISTQYSQNIEVKSLCASGIKLSIHYKEKLRFTQNNSDLHRMYPAGCESNLVRKSISNGYISFSVVDTANDLTGKDQQKDYTQSVISGFKAITFHSDIPKPGFMVTSIFCGDRIVKLTYEEKHQQFVKEITDNIKISLN